MSRPDEGLIHTWLDGESTPEEAARIERLVATDPAWAAAVAEARGLVAASSRIVQALDAVPKAMPAGSRAAPTPAAASRYRVRPWMRLAAGFVLVAGTAYLLREEPSPFEPTAQGDIAPPAPVRAESASAPGVAEVPLQRATPAPSVGASTPVVPAPQAVAAGVPPATPPVVATTAGAGRAAEFTSESVTLAARQEEQRRDVLRSRLTAAPARSAAAPAPLTDAIAGALVEKALPTLGGCWRVSAPPELVGVLREPPIVRQSGDTLVLRTTHGDVTVTRTVDRLRGGLDAMREPCPAT